MLLCYLPEHEMLLKILIIEIMQPTYDRELQKQLPLI